MDDDVRKFMDAARAHGVLDYPCGCMGGIGPAAPEGYRWTCSCGKTFELVVIEGVRSLRFVVSE